MLTCPRCKSTIQAAPRFGSVPGGMRRVAILNCSTCGPVSAVLGRARPGRTIHFRPAS